MGSEMCIRDSLWTACDLSLCLIAHQKALVQKTVDQKAVGRYPYALVHVQSFLDEPWVMPKKKPRCSMPGPPPLMTCPSPNRATKYLCVRLTRPAFSRWHVSAWFDRATTEVPRDGPNHSGAAEPTSSGHLADGFAWGRSAARLNSVQRPWQGPAPYGHCLLYTSPSPRDGLLSRMPSSA